MIFTWIAEIEQSVLRTTNQCPIDGKLRWRIPDVHRVFELQRATTNVVSQQSLVSDRFQTPSGYEFRARIFFNGSGRGKNTHCSLFIQMCKTDFDATLHYPFTGRISLEVLDQRQYYINPKRNHKKFFRTNESACFMQPEGDFCPENGLAEFISHDMLFGDHSECPIYVKNDTVFLEVVINPQVLYTPEPSRAAGAQG